MEEHRDVIKAAIEFTKHRVPVVAGTGSNCTYSHPAFTGGRRGRSRRTF